MAKSKSVKKELTLEDLPKSVVNTWDKWRKNFDESTVAKKKQTDKNLQAHFDACKKAKLDREKVAALLFKRK